MLFRAGVPLSIEVLHVLAVILWQEIRMKLEVHVGMFP